MTSAAYRWGLLTAALLVAGAIAWAARDHWFSPAAPAPAEPHPHEAKDRVRLSPQAKANLKLVVKPVSPQTYWRMIQVPGVVVERHGRNDRGVGTPIAGVVREVKVLTGDTVRTGDELFVLTLTSELLQSSQTELRRAAQELAFAEAERDRVQKAVAAMALAEAKLIEAQNQVNRQLALRKAQRSDLALRGLTGEQIDQVEQGKFVKELVIRVPGIKGEADPLLEVEEVKVRIGEPVQAGQVLGLLSDHQHLYVEGRGFKEEAALLERAAAEGWPLSAVFAEEAGGDWPTLGQTLTVRHVANVLDPASQTFPFYVPLTNQHREYQRAGKTYRQWRFKPGQRVRLGVRVERFENVLVLPADGVARDGPNAYVFRQNGDVFDRRAVRVLHEDAANVVLANDGVTPGSHVAHSAASALNRVLKASQEGGGGRDHHGHSH